MPTATTALRAAIHRALTTDGGLIAALGGARVYDEPPRDAAFPYVTLGEARISDVSADDGSTQEHQLTLHAWSRQGGHREAHVITGALLQALDDAPLSPAGHRLVNLRFAIADIRREVDGRTYHASVRFRAVTEPAN
ncbi:gene transfer agent (GTA) orfg8 [Rhodopseudomonas palustris BisB5]|uniref:Gene transfer agent (GTA) orfg8 n=1 Tax=Rhodopseudomonas palustris (strain BisB5) TaxID=316057 RepID=Q139M2_RHOPS|nr:gene transfer agent (GTA) orfg8 [Rhodopseudomonas palustris BisB5]